MSVILGSWLVHLTLVTYHLTRVRAFAATLFVAAIVLLHTRLMCFKNLSPRLRHADVSRQLCSAAQCSDRQRQVNPRRRTIRLGNPPERTSRCYQHTQTWLLFLCRFHASQRAPPGGPAGNPPPRHSSRLWSRTGRAQGRALA